MTAARQITFQVLPPPYNSFLCAVYQMDIWDKYKGFRETFHLLVMCYTVFGPISAISTWFWPILRLKVQLNLTSQAQHWSAEPHYALNVDKLSQQTIELRCKRGYSMLPVWYPLPLRYFCLHKDQNGRWEATWWITVYRRRWSSHTRETDRETEGEERRGEQQKKRKKKPTNMPCRRTCRSHSRLFVKQRPQNSQGRRFSAPLCPKLLLVLLVGEARTSGK